MALLTKQQFIDKHGYDPESKGLLPVSNQPTESKQPKETISADEFQSRYGFNPITEPTSNQPDSETISADEFQSRYGFNPITESPKNITTNIQDSTEPEKIGSVQPIVQAMQDLPTFSSKNIKKGMGSGIDGRRTVGETLGNVVRGSGDVLAGIGNSVVRSGVGLAQLVTPDEAFGENNILNSEGENAKAFMNALKGKNAGQKLGTTIGDIGTIFVPGGAASKAGTFATKATQGIKTLDALSDTSRVARALPGIAGTATEALVGSGMMGSDNIGGDVAWGVATPLALSGLSKAGSLASRWLDKEGFDAKQLASITNPANSWEAKRILESVEKGRKNFSESVIDSLESRRNVKPKRQFALADKKLNNLVDEGEIPEKDIFGEIYERPGISIGKDGNWNTSTAMDEATKNISSIGEDNQRLFDSSTSIIKANTKGAEILNDINNNLNFSTNDALNTAEKRFIDTYLTNLKKDTTPGDLYKISKELRGLAFTDQEIKAGKLPQLVRDAVKIIDAHLYSLPDVSEVALKNRKFLTKEYAIRDALDGMSRLKVPDRIKPFFGKALGSGLGAVMGGFGPAGIVMGAGGGLLGENAIQGLNKLVAQGKLPNDALQKFYSTAREKDIIDLQTEQDGYCNGCWESLDILGYHIDHVIPISKGGSNWPDNLQLLCPTCNLEKSAKMPDEWEKIARLKRKASKRWKTMKNI